MSEEDFVRGSNALHKLTEYAQAEHNREMRRLLDWIGSNSPPAPPPTLWRRIHYRVENWREDIAEGIRRFADWIDPYA